MLKFVLLHQKKKTLYFASLAPVSLDKVAMFNSYLYFQISMIIATLILAQTMQLVSMV